MLKIKHIALSAFEINYGHGSLLIDPLIELNPQYDYHSLNISDIFVTHGHYDHIGQTLNIAKDTGAQVT